MSSVQIFIPGGAQQGNAISVGDFEAEAEKQLAQLNANAELGDDVKAQASAAVEAAIALVQQEFVGEESVIAVISTRIHADALPPGSGHIVSIELSSRANPAADEALQEGEASDEPRVEVGQIPADGSVSVLISGRDATVSGEPVNEQVLDEPASGGAVGGPVDVLVGESGPEQFVRSPAAPADEGAADESPKASSADPDPAT